MNRMGRHKDIHKKAKPLKRDTGSIFARRGRKRTRMGNEENATRIYERKQHSLEHLNQYEQQIYRDAPGTEEQQKNKKFFNRQKKNKPLKSRRKQPWKKIILSILLVLILYSGISLFIGKYVAEHDTSSEATTSETFHRQKATNGAHNILILGSDTRGEDTGRADTIVVLQLDGPSHKLKLISFIRDSFVTVPGVGQDKINPAYTYGEADLVRQTLVENFGINCQYYVKIDSKSFERVIDALFMSGMKIDTGKDLNLDGVDIKKGIQKMDGHVLLQYVRFRMDEEGGFGRVGRQQQVMNAIFSRLKNPLNLIRAPYTAGKALGYISTDVTAWFLTKNLFSIARGAGGIDRVSVPVDGPWNYGQSDYASSIFETDNQMNQSAITDFLNK